MTSTSSHSPRQLFAPSGRPAGDTGSEHLPSHSPVWIVMGVSGSGKSHIGSMLAERFELPFLDADDFHPRNNIEKMASGVPLTDRDRKPWLEQLSERLEQGSRAGGVVLACSALKETYRSTLASRLDRPPIWIWLDGEKPLIRERLQTRDGHFMPDTLLDSQFLDLEPPEETCVSISPSLQRKFSMISRIIPGFGRTVAAGSPAIRILKSASSGWASWVETWRSTWQITEFRLRYSIGSNRTDPDLFFTFWRRSEER
ncbi:MAG: gluconokinase [Bacteroidota bacterium]